MNHENVVSCTYQQSRPVGLNSEVAVFSGFQFGNGVQATVRSSTFFFRESVEVPPREGGRSIHGLLATLEV